MEKIDRWLVTAVDYGKCCSGKAVLLGAFKTKADAEEYLKNDIDSWYSRHLDEGAEVDYVKMSARLKSDPETKCEWQIHQQKIEVC